MKRDGSLNIKGEGKQACYGDLICVFDLLSSVAFVGSRLFVLLQWIPEQPTVRAYRKSTNMHSSWIEVSKLGKVTEERRDTKRMKRGGKGKSRESEENV